MHNFEYCCSTEIVFGKDTENKAGAKVKQYGGTKVALVYGGNSAKSSGLLDRIKDSLSAENIEVLELGGVKPNPRLSFVVEGVKKAQEFGVDFLLAVGGGSVIDTAKAIAVGIANPEADVWEDFWSKKTKAPKSLPVGAVLTISAAGSETSDSAVLTKEETHQKIGCSTERPVFAIMNPVLTYTLPRYQIACGITDIMMHTMDRYFAHEEGNHFTDRVAEELLKNVIKYGKAAMVSRKDYEAMSELMWCGSVSHTGFTGLGRQRDFSCHKFGHELSGIFDVAHGASLAAMWSSWARFVYQDNPARFAQFAEKVWGVEGGTVEEKARAGIRMTEEFFKSIGMPICISQLVGRVATAEEIEKMADLATANGSKKVAVFHPLSKQDMMKVYEMANY